MDIYFAGSIRGGRKDVGLYNDIIKFLENTYGEVLTGHIGNKELAVRGEDGLKDTYIHDRDLAWLMRSRVVIAEITTPSLGVGYEIGRAVENGIPVLCLHRPKKGKRLPAMIAGCPEIINREYQNLDNVKDAVGEFFKMLAEKSRGFPAGI